MLTEQQLTEGWALHDGTGCPVDRPTSVLLRCGVVATAVPHAEAWTHKVLSREGLVVTMQTQPTDIVAYIPFLPKETEPCA